MSQQPAVSNPEKASSIALHLWKRPLTARESRYGNKDRANIQQPWQSLLRRYFHLELTLDGPSGKRSTDSELVSEDVRWISASGATRRTETTHVIAAQYHRQWNTFCAALYWSRNAHLTTWQATPRMPRNVFNFGWNTFDPACRGHEKKKTMIKLKSLDYPRILRWSNELT